MQPPNDPVARDERSSATGRADEERAPRTHARNQDASERDVEGLERDGQAVRRERSTLDQLRQRAVDAEAEARRQQEQHDEGAARSPGQRDQVLIDREVALSNAGLLYGRVHELLDRTQQQLLEAAAGRRGRDPATARPAAVQDSEDPAADRDQREIERNMVQPPDEPAE